MLVHLVIAKHIGQPALVQLGLGYVIGLLGGNIFAVLDQRLAAVAKGGYQLGVGIIQHYGLGHVAVAVVDHADGYRNRPRRGKAGRLYRQAEADGLLRLRGQRKQQHC